MIPRTRRQQGMAATPASEMKIDVGARHPCHPPYPPAATVAPLIPPLDITPGQPPAKPRRGPRNGRKRCFGISEGALALVRLAGLLRLRSRWSSTEQTRTEQRSGKCRRREGREIAPRGRRTWSPRALFGVRADGRCCLRQDGADVKIKTSSMISDAWWIVLVPNRRQTCSRKASFSNGIK